MDTGTRSSLVVPVEATCESEERLACFAGFAEARGNEEFGGRKNALGLGLENLICHTQIRTSHR